MWGSMPVDKVVKFRNLNLDQATPTWAHVALPGLRPVLGTVCGAHQPMTCQIEKLIWLVIHFHRHMAAAVQIGMNLPLIANGERSTRLTPISHLKGDGEGAVP